MPIPVRQTMTSIRWACNSTKWQPTKSDWIRAAQSIQPEERERIGQFVFKRDAKLSMVGRLLLRRVIHQITELPYKKIKLVRSEKGKPYLENLVKLPIEFRTFHFNVSHQGDYVVLAAETNCEVGIDVMNTEIPRAKSVPDFFHTMRRQFTNSEWSFIKSFESEADQLKAFYRLWCLKESYVKALGTGIGFEVSRLDFRISEPVVPDSTMISSTSLILDGEEKPHWIFEETCLEDHNIAVAVHRENLTKETSGPPPEFTLLAVEELLEDMPSLHKVLEQYGESFMNKDESPGQPQTRNQAQ